MKYTVIEMQNGVIGSNVWQFETREEAESKFYAVLSVAAVSSVAVHTVMIVTDEGFSLDCKCYKH